MVELLDEALDDKLELGEYLGCFEWAAPVALLVAIRRRGDGGTAVVTRSFARFIILQGRFDSGR